MIVEDWGLIPYPDAERRQLELVESVRTGAEEHLILCCHPSVVTLGRASKPEDIQGWSGEIFQSARGGRATYHGPSQLVVYPIYDLRREHMGIRSRDVHSYLRWLEQTTSACLNELGIPNAEPGLTQADDDISRTGVWVSGRKIASIGVAIRGWVTYHGLALNLAADPLAFTGIKPCGFTTEAMTSIEIELGQSANRDQTAKTWLKYALNINPI